MSLACGRPWKLSEWRLSEWGGSPPGVCVYVCTCVLCMLDVCKWVCMLVCLRFIYCPPVVATSARDARARKVGFFPCLDHKDTISYHLWVLHIHRVGQNHTFIGIYDVYTVLLAGNSPYTRSYTVCVHTVLANPTHSPDSVVHHWQRTGTYGTAEYSAACRSTLVLVCASATGHQLLLSRHSLRCANHPFYAWAWDSLQLCLCLVSARV
jgi:hypothetical protein